MQPRTSPSNVGGSSLPSGSCRISSAFGKSTSDPGVAPQALLEAVSASSCRMIRDSGTTARVPGAVIDPNTVPPLAMVTVAPGARLLTTAKFEHMTTGVANCGRVFDRS